MALVEPSTPQELGPQETLAFMSGVFSTVRRVVHHCAPRLVHIHASSLLARPAMGVATSLGIPFVIHVHGTIHEGDSRTFRNQVRHARWVCAVSQAVADSIRRDCGRSDPVWVIRNGVIDPVETTIAFDPRSPSVAMIGRFTHEKGFDDGLRALAAVRPQHPGLEVRLVGVGPMVADLHELAASLGMVDCVRYFGELEHGDGLRVMAGADVVLVPSSGIEGFGLVAVEAALLERPVVATWVGGLPETVEDGVGGLLVMPGDIESMASAIGALLADPERRGVMGATARLRAQECFGIERFVDDIAHLYGLMTDSGGDHET